MWWFVIGLVIGLVGGWALCKHRLEVQLGLIKKLHEIRDSHLVANLSEAEVKILNRAKSLGRKF